MKLNLGELVQFSIGAEIAPAIWPPSRIYRVGMDGVCRVLPGTGGITYSHVIGDSAVKLRGDHVEPGVSAKGKNSDESSSLNTFACVGNEAVMISGPAKGAKGIVCGTHGGVNHVMIDFPMAAMRKMTIGDRIQIVSHGVGLSLLDHPEIVPMNCDPSIFNKWGVKSKGKTLEVPVTHLIPAKVMGSGIGATSCYSGDYDIQMFDPGTVRSFRLDTLRFGDIVAIVDADHTYGRAFFEGAISVGVVVHSRSDQAGHGPGVATLLTSKTGMIKPVIKSDANIGKFYGLGKWRKKK